MLCLLHEVRWKNVQMENIIRIATKSRLIDIEEVSEKQIWNFNGEDIVYYRKIEIR